MTFTHAPHPTFGIWFQRFFIRAWLVIVGLFISGLLLLKNGFSTLGAILAISFGISIIFTLSYLFYRLYHIDCPDCHSQLKTQKNVKLSKYVAICDRCQKTWDIGIGIGTSD
jgi:phosphoglycerol transferase MdoB-like AlkP superfamily enzyme